MAVDIVLSIIAADRPGLVGTLADIVAAEGGNWVESEMARLGGAFAGIVRVTVDAGSADALETRLKALADQGITVHTRRSDEEPPAAGHAAALELTGSDHPGIVRDVARALAGLGVSIDELETDIFPGSMSGEAMFSARARIVLPEGLSPDGLRDALEALAQDIMVEIDLKPEA